MKTSDIRAEYGIHGKVNRIIEKTPEPVELNLSPPPAFIRKNQKQFALRLIMAILVTIIIATTGVLAFTGNIPFIPGIVSSAGITHSIEKELIFEQGDYGHRIMYGYVKDSEVFLKILYYDPVIGLTDNQPVGDRTKDMVFPHDRQDYDVYYNGTACTNYHKNYSNASADLQYKLPQVLEDERMIFELYGDNQKIGDIEMIPISQSMEFIKERPHATVGDITLTAEITQENEVIDIYISAVLPNPVDYYDIVGEHLNGYAESDVYLMDKAGNKFTNLGGRIYEYPTSISNGKYDADALLMFYHHYRFDLNELEDEEYTLVIPSVTYLENKVTVFKSEKKSVEVNGPFEMSIRIP